MDTVSRVVGACCFFLAVCTSIVRGQANNSIPFTTECIFTRHGREYVGTRNVTDRGNTCQAWASNSPHSHPFTSATSNEFPGDGGARQAGNKCRNPDQTWNKGLWCYTMNPTYRWQSCSVPMCECKLNWDLPGANYLGVLSTTRTGKLCQRWNVSSPHQHPFNNASFFKDDSVAKAENYCRNPNVSRPDGPWCYTVDPSAEWEYCAVPVCNLTTPDLPTSATTATIMSTKTTVTSTRASPTTRSTQSTRQTTRSTRRTESARSIATSTIDPNQDRPTGNAVLTNVLVPSVVSIGVIILVVALVVYLRCYRDGKASACDVIRRILPGKQTSSGPERMENSRDAINPPSIIPPPVKDGFSNPLYETRTAPPADQQPNATGPEAALTVAVDEGRVTMSHIQLA